MVESYSSSATVIVILKLIDFVVNHGKLGRTNQYMSFKNSIIQQKYLAIQNALKGIQIDNRKYWTKLFAKKNA